MRDKDLEHSLEGLFSGQEDHGERIKMTEIPSAPSNQVPYAEVELDPRPYIEALVRHWWLIIGLALVAAIAGFLYGSRGSEQYTAEANVSLLDVHSLVSFDPQFKTVPNDPTWREKDERAAALRALAESKSLRNEVFVQVSPQLEPDSPDFGAFLDSTEAGLAGDMLRLRVTQADPEVAALIANAWAERFVTVANKSYMSTSSGTFEEAGAASGEAFGKYRAVQRDLEVFIAENDLDRVRGEIAKLDVLIEGLQTQKTDAVRLAAENQVRQLNDLYDRRAYLEGAQVRLEELQAQLAGGTLSPAAGGGDAMAVMFTRANLFGQGPAADMLLNIDLAQLGEGGYLLASSDVQDLRRIVDEGLAEVNTKIERLTNELFLGTGLEVPSEVPADHQLFQLVNAQLESTLNLETAPGADTTGLDERPLSRNLAQLSGQRQALRARLESLEAQERELTLARDTAWDLYKTLDNKAREVAAQLATGAPQARLVVRAASPYGQPNSRGGKRQALVAAALGAMLGVLYVLGRTYWVSNVPVEEPGPPAEEAPGRQLPQPQPAVE